MRVSDRLFCAGRAGGISLLSRGSDLGGKEKKGRLWLAGWAHLFNVSTLLGVKQQERPSPWEMLVVYCHYSILLVYVFIDQRVKSACASIPLRSVCVCGLFGGSCFRRTSSGPASTYAA